MHEFEPRGVQRLPGETRELRRSIAEGARPVHAIANQRMSVRVQVDPDLMGSTRREAALEQRRILESPEHAIESERGPAPRNDRHARPVAGMAPDRRLDFAIGAHRAAGEREIVAFDGARLKLAHQVGVGVQRLRDDEQSARVLVQPVHDARARDPAKLRRMVQQRVHHRTLPVAAAGMDHHSRRLVDDDQRFIFENDGKFDGLRAGGGLFRVGLWHHQNAFAAPEFLLGLCRHGIQENVPGAQPRLQAAAGMFGQQSRERLIEPHAGVMRGHDYRQLRSAGPSIIGCSNVIDDHQV